MNQAEPVKQKAAKPMRKEERQWLDTVSKGGF
jgi:hypothetical protein